MKKNNNTFSTLADDPHSDIVTFLTLSQKNTVGRTSRKEQERMRNILKEEARIRIPLLPTIIPRIEALESETIRHLFSVDEILHMMNLSYFHNNSRLLAFMKKVAKTMIASSPHSDPADESLLLSLEDVIEKRIRRLDYQRNFKNIIIDAYIDYLFSLPDDPHTYLTGFLDTVSSLEIRSRLAESFIKMDECYKKRRTLTPFLNPMARKRLDRLL